MEEYFVHILKQLNSKNVKMKNILYKCGILLFATIIVSSCESPEGVTNYTPADYEFPTSITLTPGNITNSSVNLTFSSSGTGKAYYVVVEGGSAAPSPAQVFNASAVGTVASGSFNLQESPTTLTIDGNLCNNTAYKAYVVHFTSDSFLSQTAMSTSFTTLDHSLAGTYNVVSNGTLSSNFDPITTLTNYESVVIITDNGDGTYTFDDATAGFYADVDYYGDFGHSSLPHTFDVPCNTIEGTFDTEFADCCGDAITFMGTINADGTISVHWESAFGESIDAIYTKQ